MCASIVQTMGLGPEAGKLQAELQSVFRKMLSHTRVIECSMAMSDAVEALGQLRELEAYLEKGLEILSRPLARDSPIPD